ncbi:hypothetical protein [Enterococcus faecium]|uniref:hypothetical protein n=1 Tax=Enterococcus faecium TaxID=1352 RepID=UPI000F636775|nr:hypothetical protein [Enterococcus faecium]RRQ85376.1 hypothetical protein CUR46_10795 [Enterococcus faecium]
MIYTEFKEWLEKNTTGYETFIIKATNYQIEKNKNRPPKKRWDYKKIDKAVLEMWKQVVTNLYQTIRKEKGVPLINGKEIWLEFIEEQGLIEFFNDSMAELEFE